jgi:hypothetical protein
MTLANDSQHKIDSYLNRLRSNDSGIAGVILGASYILSKRNLWVCVLAHGFIDTFGVACAFFGWGS